MCSIWSNWIRFEAQAHAWPGTQDTTCSTWLVKILKESLPTKNTQRNTTQNSTKRQYLLFSKKFAFCCPNSRLFGKFLLHKLFQRCSIRSKWIRFEGQTHTWPDIGGATCQILKLKFWKNTHFGPKRAIFWESANFKMADNRPSDSKWQKKNFGQPKHT